MNMSDDNDILCSDFETILLNADETKSYLKKLQDNCIQFHAKLENHIQESALKNSENLKQAEKASETVSHLFNQKKELKSAIENIKLEQKILEKNAINRFKDIEKTKNAATTLKEKKEKLSLEVKDLEEESEKSKIYMKKQWEAVKKACRMYKNVLDIHINLETDADMERVTVEYFWNENPHDKKFCVVFMCQDNCWRVKKIEPELSMEKKYQLSDIIGFSEQCELANIPLLLCELRKLFIKNYFE